MIVLTCLVAPQLAGYKRVGGDHGVEVYRQMASPVIELMAEGDIDTPPFVVREVLLDYAQAGKITKRVAESHILNRGDHELIVYQRLSLPIVTDRDYNQRVTWGTSGDTSMIRFAVDNEHGQGGRPGVVRVNVLSGGWDLKPIRGGTATHALYHVRIDLSGSIPRWMVSGGAAKDLPKLFDGLRRQSRERMPSLMNAARPTTTF
jgi:hypothetical protein